MRKRGFTLVELLIVISILVLLMGLLLPAVIGAMNNMKRVQAVNQLESISKGVGAYYSIFSCLPGVPVPWNAAQPMTGAQLLQVALVGYATNNTWPDGVPRQPLHAVHPGELVNHASVPLNTSATFTYNGAQVSPNFPGTVPVFVDYMFSNPRPILYYRFYETSAHAAWGVTPGPDMQAAFNFNDNSVYCMPGEQFGNFIGAAAVNAGYVLISAGPDRQYFTSSCICSAPQ